jgi:hypothetical protein
LASVSRSSTSCLDQFRLEREKIGAVQVEERLPLLDLVSGECQDVFNASRGAGGDMGISFGVELDVPDDPDFSGHRPEPDGLDLDAGRLQGLSREGYDVRKGGLARIRFGKAGARVFTGLKSQAENQDG